MRSRVGLVIAVLAAIGFAGCIEEGDFVPVQGADTSSPDDGNTTTPPAGSGDDGTQGNGTDDGNATTPNTAPVANLTADVLNGTAPLNVTFTIDGSDADGDQLTWSLSIDGTEVANGTQVPATVGHTFDTAGSFAALLEISDGLGTAWANLTIDVTTAAPESPQPIVRKGTIVAPVSPSAIGFGCVAVIFEDGIDGDAHTFTEDIVGWSYDVTVEMTANFWVYWRGADDASLEDGSSGTVPAGFAYAEVCVDLAVPNSEYTLTITPP